MKNSFCVALASLSLLISFLLIISCGISGDSRKKFELIEATISDAGITRNPYDLERVPAGSSGGTAAAVAANFGAVGLGTDTGNSIRGPSSHNCLVGIRSTMSLTSRDGIIPLYLRKGLLMTICLPG